MTATYCVLDIETGLSDAAAVLVDRGTKAMADRPALQELVAASVLTFSRASDGRFGSFSLGSVAVGEEREEGVLARLDALLSPVYAAGGTLVTYHGIVHDLPALRRRFDRHWMFEAFRYPDWTSRERPRHVDLIRWASPPGAKGWVSLADACAGMGFAAGPPARSAEGQALRDPVGKSQMDVVAEAVLFFYYLASIEGSARPLLQGWTELSSYLLGPDMRLAHLDCLARHPYAGVARRILAKGRR